ncbi:MAG: PEGA domain-containing protein [Rubrivivax sp.]|nr:PEGA domain-containing protein [Rubrivivax sp.]
MLVLHRLAGRRIRLGGFKVYVGDVYHGLTPLTLELPAGVHVLHFRRDGCRTVTEKVAVRRAATVELEIKLPDC